MGGGKVGLPAKVKNNGGYFELDYTRKGQKRQPHKQKTPSNVIPFSLHMCPAKMLPVTV